MARPVFSPNWFRVAEMKPRLRPHASTHRQVFRGADWYVLQDDQTGRYHRLSPAANHMVGLMDGRRSVETIWRATLDWLGPEAQPPTQDEVIRLLSQLHAADLLAGGAPPDFEELAHRADDRARKALMARLRNPLALRLPLFDPDRFLTATLPLARPFFTVWGGLVWLAVVLTGLVLAALNWAELTGNLRDQVLMAENLILMALLYPPIKALHELGHGYAAKIQGGAVHEFGMMLLVLMPVPYVDASTASGFASKWQRALVGGAGILVELLLAGLAMIVWASVEPGLVRAAALNVALIAGVSTLLFNGNPLLRFDGYYVLCDLVEIPNLGTRANRHLQHLIKRHAFGLRESVSPVTARGEAAWFTVYAIAAFVYRVFIMVAIALFIATQFFVLGVLLALWALWLTLVWPVLKGLWWLWDSAELGPRRGRAMALTAGSVAALAAALALVPLPFASTATGVVWLPEAAHLRAEGSGVLLAGEPARDARAGLPVTAGETLYRLDDPLLRARHARLAAQRAELALQLAQEGARAPARAAVLREQLASLDAALELFDDRLAALSITSPRDGLFIDLAGPDAIGRHIRRGDLLGYVVAPDDARVRAVLPVDRADLLQQRAGRAEVRLAHRPAQTLPATLGRDPPTATHDLPAAALGSAGGGPVATDPRAAEPTRALSPVLQVDVAVALGPEATRPGLRALVRIDHGTATLAERGWRGLRQLLLRQFDV